jgi:hypothetical protein
MGRELEICNGRVVDRALPDDDQDDVDDEED